MPLGNFHRLQVHIEAAYTGGEGGGLAGKQLLKVGLRTHNR